MQVFRGKRSSGLMGGALVALAISLPSAVSAQSTTFATFSQVNNADVIRVVNDAATAFSGSTTRFGTYDASGAFISAGIPISFTYITANNYGASGVGIAGTMTMTATVSAKAIGGSGDPVTQRFNNFVMEFRANTPVNSNNLLLKISGTTRFIGDTSTGSSNVTENNPGGLIPGGTNGPFNIEFSSDFLNFTPNFSNQNYSLGINNITPFVDVENGYADPTKNGYIRSFRSNISGNFASDPPPTTHNNIPEPTSLAFLFSGVMGAAVVTLRRRSAN